MSNPNCTGGRELDLGVNQFGRLGQRAVEGRFYGSMASDGGVMLPSAAVRKLGLTAAVGRCIADRAIRS